MDVEVVKLEENAPRPKRRLNELAEEYGVEMETLEKLVFKHLDESMVSGRGKALWINEDGQAALEGVVPFPQRYRGQVLRDAPNKNYVYAFVHGLSKKVPVEIPRRLRGRLVGKLIYIDENNSGPEPKYVWSKAPFM